MIYTRLYLFFYFLLFMASGLISDEVIRLAFILLLLAAGLVSAIVHNNKEAAGLQKLPVVTGHIEAIEEQMSNRTGKIFILIFEYEAVTYKILEDVFIDADHYWDKRKSAKAGDKVNIHITPENPYLSFSEFNR